MVLVAHSPWPAWCRRGWGARLIDVGSYGVDLFFVLSGFLISGLLLAEHRRWGRVDVPRFWLRRGLKIWPSYYVAYGAVLIVDCVIDVKNGGDPGTRLNRMVPNLVFLQTYIHPENRWPGSWSLAIEEHFYTVLPLLMSISLLSRRGMKLLPWVCGLVCLIEPVLRFVGRDPEAVYLQTHFRADALSYGVLLGYAYSYNPRIYDRVDRWRLLLLALPLFALAIPAFLGWESCVTRSVGLSVLAVTFAGLTALAAARPEFGLGSIPPARAVFRLLIWLGTYSYTIYLVGSVLVFRIGGGRVNHYLSALTGSDVDVGVAVYAVVSILGGVLLSHAVERPFLVQRERWVPRPIRESKIP
jgi:peptidoglycan/LPS O-acetylase OafA/YrhL